MCTKAVRVAFAVIFASVFLSLTPGLVVGESISGTATFVEQGGNLADLLTITYTASNGSLRLTSLTIDLSSTSGGVRFDTAANLAFNIGGDCIFCTNVNRGGNVTTILDTGVGLTTRLDFPFQFNLDGKDQATFAFSDFQPGDAITFGVDLDRTIPAPFFFVSSSDLTNGKVVAEFTLPGVIERLVVSSLMQPTGASSARADLIVDLALDPSLKPKNPVVGAVKLGIAAASIACSFLCGPPGVISQFIGGVSAGISVALFLDPFDPLFALRVSPTFRPLPQVSATVTFPQLFADTANAAFLHGGRAIGFLEALSASMNRLSSAQQVGDAPSVLLQRRAIEDFLSLSSFEMEQYAAGLRQLSVLIKGSPFDISVSTEQITTILNALHVDGFDALPEDERNLFDLFQVDATARQIILDAFLTVDPSQVPRTFSQALAGTAAAFEVLAGLYAPSATFIVRTDIKPGESRNVINPRSQGKIPVAILSSDVFDATSIDASSVRFGPKGASPALKRGQLVDIDGDGKLDLLLHFNTAETGILCGATSASLDGQTIGRGSIKGSDSIVTVGCH